jgi:Flp pilus assembly CpaF family ATPase
VRRALERIYNPQPRRAGRALRADRGRRPGLRPIEPLLRDDSVTEVLVNGPHQVYIERNGILEETDIRFRDNDAR